jgi:hypothetical protein
MIDMCLPVFQDILTDMHIQAHMAPSASATAPMIPASLRKLAGMTRVKGQ